MNRQRSWIVPDWPAPSAVHAAVTTRIGGVSLEPYATFNLAAHVGDNPSSVSANRARLRDTLQLPSEPVWLRQVHGVKVIDAGQAGVDPEADGAYTMHSGIVCTVLTADCLPVLLCDRSGTRVAALHAGWRGLVNGVIEAGVKALGLDGHELMAWLGPAIGPTAFEVGAEVRQAFTSHDPQAETAFLPLTGGKYLANIYQLARQRLTTIGIHQIFGGDFCTVRDTGRFYSFRRDGATGRMASLIWLSSR
ncbi:MAG TPA: peptidoglycan editing factor PgeF [Gammaproteobacteria bacterium]|nr:peptidoglycan editing factor PgeF [Gammaproteobacteria bacterium]